ncbi:MAG TPA: TetR/AcrR family transcriptional regulator [Longimicrobiales bacterium]|nr:TetR/AcrR family transcriptional regulator [Longimicrobiales bacterium]
MSTKDTRQRIVEAVVSLHQEVGPVHTTVTGIAERAGVQRLTVYRHFPDERSLIEACSAHWSVLHPAPDPARWMGIADPEARSRRALEELFAYYRDGAPMLEKIFRDVDQVTALQEVMVPFRAYLAEVAGVLATGWEGPAETQRFVRAATGHAVRFETWRSLTGEGVSDEAAAVMLSGWFRCIARGEGRAVE